MPFTVNKTQVGGSTMAVLYKTPQATGFLAGSASACLFPFLARPIFTILVRALMLMLDGLLCFLW
jgi:hypothetical protein